MEKKVLLFGSLVFTLVSTSSVEISAVGVAWSE